MRELTTDNFLLFAAKHYNNPSCTDVQEFYDDLKRFKYIKRLLRRYKRTGDLTERLILNHLILLHNVFHQAMVPMVFHKIEEEYWPQLKTFLVFLNYLPDNYLVRPGTMEAAITLDPDIVDKLRSL